MKKIVLTGGGTAGHVTPNIALLPGLQKLGYQIDYIGSYEGIEKRLIESYHIPYHGISSGKLRRYFDVKNFTDPFKVMKGYHQAVRLLGKLKPDIVFSKGGFVSVPVVLAAKHRRIPVIIHESDITPGLANKLAIPSATKGSKEKALEFCGFEKGKPVMLVIGGSIGSVFINQVVREALPQLLKEYQVIHLCGKGNLDNSLAQTKGYAQYEYIKDELKDLFALADIVVSRAGANAICELLALHKPNILIPLSAAASRGDQILNARSFEKQGFSYVIEEETLTVDILLEAIRKVYADREDYRQAMEKSNQMDSVETILQLIESEAGK